MIYKNISKIYVMKIDNILLRKDDSAQSENSGLIVEFMCCECQALHFPLIFRVVFKQKYDPGYTFMTQIG